MHIFVIIINPNGPHITVPLIYCFLIMIFNLCLHHQYVYILEIVLDIWTNSFKIPEMSVDV